MATTATITGAQFDRLPYDEGRKWELIEGELIPVPSPTVEHQDIVFHLLAALKKYLVGKEGITSQDVEFALSADTRARPDVWVLLGNAAKIDRAKVPVPGAPDIAVEVISASEYTSQSMRKVDAYLKYGTQEVWQIYPQTRLVVVFNQNQSSRKLNAADTLTTPLLPGFELPILSLFE